jgi:NAD(P)-dependent dehydrogenase (short-subunit alcohol dehydrogenase family)
MIEHPFVLTGKVALVTGASRGVGKGVVLGLAEAEATVYLTGRSSRSGGSTVELPGTIEDTGDEARALGGEAIPIRCDHRDDDGVRAVVERIAAERGRLDVLVNNVWGGYEYLHRGEYQHANAPFRTRPLSLWAGLVRTESVLAAANSGFFDLSNSESPQFIGRAVAALAADPHVLERTGRAVVAAELAEEYGFTDVDGTRPRSLRAQFDSA